MRGHLRLLGFLLVCLGFAPADVHAVPECTTASDCVHPCRIAAKCSTTGICSWAGGDEPDGKACTGDGNTTTDDYCVGGDCQHVVDCTTQPFDYCDHQPSGVCTYADCVQVDVAPGSNLQLPVWTVPGHDAPRVQEGQDLRGEPGSICRNGEMRRSDGGSLPP
jgi:hypothetical protein